MNWIRNNIVLLVTVFLYCITLFVATQWRYPEIDEIYFTDAPANLLLNGKWMSHILWSQFLYQPLHAVFLVPWMFAFGVSHFSVCAFGVFLGFITCVLLPRFAKKLGYISNAGQELMIVVIFWALNTFTDYETFGRPDNLGMLITLIIVFLLLKKSDLKFWIVILLGVLLIWVGVYEVPVMVFFFLFMMLISFNNKKDVIKWLGKATGFGIGVLIGELMVCVFFFFNTSTSVYRYIQYTFLSGMNANASSTLSFGQRLCDAYSSNWYITAIFLIVLMVMLIKKIPFNKPIALFTLLTPALMVLAGRFVPYYTWIYYVPMCVFLACYLNTQKVLAISTSFLFVLTSITYLFLQFSKPYGCQTAPIKELEVIKKDCRRFFDKNYNLIAKYKNVVLSEEQLYYDVINLGAEVWFQYRKNLTHKLDFYNYDIMQTYLNPGKERQSDKYSGSSMMGTFVKYYKEYNPQLKPFPDDGICIYTCDYEKETSLEFLKHFGYNYECIMEDGNYSIYSFEKN